MESQGRSAAGLSLFDASGLADVEARSAAVAALHAATAIYTAEPVVDQLLDQVTWPRGGGRLVDPSCGDGMFLARALVRLLAEMPGCGPSGVAEALEGWEIHPAAAGAARDRLQGVLVGHGWAVARAAAAAAGVVRCGDFLTEGPSGARYDVIAGNPPYLRFLNVPELLRREYAAVLPVHAQADLLHAFLDRCDLTLRPGGVVALVTADRWLFNAGAAKLREVLGQRFGIRALARLDVTTSFYRPKQRRLGAPPRIHPVAVVLGAKESSSLTLGAEPVYPDGQGEGVAGPTLGDVAEVRLAPWLGSAGIFVVDGDVAAGLPRECLVPAIDTDDVRGGELQEPTRFALRTRPEVEPPAAVMAHLAANLPRMAPRGRRVPAWLPPESWHKKDLSRPSLLVPRIAKSLKPVRVPPGVLPVNHNLSVVSAGKASLDAIEAVLRSPEAEAWVRARAARLENGYYSLTTSLLRRLPVPALVGAAA